MVEQESYFNKERKFQRGISVALYSLLAPRRSLVGKENVQNAASLLSTNNKLIVISNHLSHGDAEFIRQTLKSNGFGKSKEIIFLAGEKLNLSFFTRWLAKSQNTVYVWPKSLIPKNDEEKKQARTMTKKAFLDSAKALSNQHPEVVFPEGGRSYKARLIEAVPEVAHFLNLADVLLPIGISGIEKIFPPQKLPRFKPWIKSYIAVGEPVDVKALFEQFKDSPKEERNARIMKHVMEQYIAPLVPESYRGVYS